MNRRDFVALGAGTLVAAPHAAAQAQQSSIPVIGWLNVAPLASANSQNIVANFRKGLAEVGFVEGKDLTIDYRSGEGRAERLPELAADLVRRGVAAIMAGSPPAALAAKAATSIIPIVFTSGADPVRIGLVASFNRPGGNVTGFHLQAGEVVGKRLALLREMVPRARRIAVLVNPGNPSDGEAAARDATEAARSLGIEIQVFKASTADEFDAAFAALALWRADGVLVVADPFFSSRSTQMAVAGARHATPTSCPSRADVGNGCLMSYGPDGRDLYRRAGHYVGRILKGEKPADLPVQQPSKFELVINGRTAKALALTIPPALEALAEEVIE